MRRPYLGGSRGRAVKTLASGLRDHEPLVLLTGPAEVGKTTVLNAVLETVKDDLDVIRLNDDPSHRAVTRADLEPRVADAGTRAVVVDDAHALADDALGLLLRLASPARPRPARVLLAGRGEFWERDGLNELGVIARLAMRVTLAPLTLAEVRALATETDFNDVTDDAVALVLDETGGLPGRVARVITSASQVGGTVLTARLVRQVTHPDEAAQPADVRARGAWLPWLVLGAAAAVAAVATLAWPSRPTLTPAPMTIILPREDRTVVPPALTETLPSATEAPRDGHHPRRWHPTRRRGPRPAERPEDSNLENVPGIPDIY